MRKKLLLIPIILTFILVGCTKNKEETDAQKFAKEYTTMTEDNYFVYRNIEEIIKILEHGTGVVYFGFPECPWCQAYVTKLNEVADIEGLEKIYYYNIYEDRKNNTDEYKKIVSLLGENLQYDDEGNLRVFVPNVSFHVNGKIIDNDCETSLDTNGFTDPKDYWTDEKIKLLKLKLVSAMSQVKNQSGLCTDCNK
jgi:hypothetical protein